VKNTNIFGTAGQASNVSIFLHDILQSLLRCRVNSTLLWGPYLSRDNIPGRTCRIWFTFHTVVVLGLFLALESVLALRMYALYLKDRRIGFFLAVVLVLSWAANVIFSVITLKGFRFSQHCVGHGMAAGPLFFGATVVTKQTLVWALTAYRRRTARVEGWSNADVLKQTVRDGTGIFMLTIAVISASEPYIYLRGVVAHFVFTLPISLLSIFTCRLILNALSIKIESDPTLG